MRKTNASTARKAGIVATFLAGLSVAAAASFGGYRAYQRAVIRDVSRLLQGGYPTLASERIDPIRQYAGSSEMGCRLMLGAYIASWRLDRMSWAAETCMAAGFKVPEAALALARVDISRGQDREATRLLRDAASSFQNLGVFDLELARLFKRSADKTGAVQAYLAASDREPKNPVITAEALSYLVSTGAWNEARIVAERLRLLKIEDPASLLDIAETLLHFGDRLWSRRYMKQAWQQLEGDRDYRTELEQRYPELRAEFPADFSPDQGQAKQDSFR